MDDEAYVYARAWLGRVLHVVRYAVPPNGEIRRARCGLVPRGGWELLVSSIRPNERRCRRCAERE
jgi:hypothetical protein